MIAPSRRTTPTSKFAMYRSSKQPSEKRFSAVFFCASHSSDTARNCGKIAGTPSRGMISKLAPSRIARRCVWRRSERAGPSSENVASGTRASSPSLLKVSPRSMYRGQAVRRHLINTGETAMPSQFSRNSQARASPGSAGPMGSPIATQLLPDA